MKKIMIVLLTILFFTGMGCDKGTKKGFLPFLSIDDGADGSSKGETELESIYVTPPQDSIAVGTYSKFKATGIYKDGTHEDITDSSTWSSETTSISTVDEGGKAQGVSPGSTKVIATKDGLSGNGELIVKDVTLEYIEVSRFAPIATGTTARYQAIGVFSDGTTQNLTEFVEWSSSSESTAPVNNVDDGTKGKASGSSVGQTTITASLSGISGNSTLEVVNKTLVSISIDPDTSIAKDSQKKYKAIGTYSDGSTQDLTNDVTWSSSDTGIATINNSASSKGTSTGMSSGNATITATLGGISGSSTLTVTNATLTSISIGPDVSIAKGTNKQFTAIGTYSDGTTVDISDLVTWTSSAIDIAGISNVSGSQGYAQSLKSGTTEIKAILGEISASANLTVTSATLASISVTPPTDTIVAGTNTQYTATGSFSDGTTQDITELVSWSSSNESIGIVSNISGNNGKAYGDSAGTIIVTATLEGVSGTANLVVNPAVTLSSISVTPATKSIAKGLTQQYIATAIYSDSTTQDVTTSATWKSDSNSDSVDDSLIAGISNASGTKGLATANNQGTTVISATFDGMTGTANLTVTAATLVSIDVTPANVSRAKGLTQQYTAMGTYTDNSTQDITNSVTWKSDGDSNDIDDSLYASISNASGSKGLATTTNVGATVISATLDGKTGSTNLTVTAAEIISLSITPANQSIAKGLTQQYTATATMTDSSTQDVTTAATWSSGTTSIATISNAGGSKGLATSASEGTTVISASYSGQDASTNLTVIAATVVSIAVTPTNPSVAKGLTKQFTATAMMTDSSTQNVTTASTWTSGTTSIATISNASGSKGLATSANTGVTLISATWNGKTGSTNLTVTAAELVSITVTPANQSIAKGLTQQYTATGVYTDGSTQNLTTTATWSSSSTGIASISNAGGSQGLATTSSVGGTTITATYGGISGNTGLTVTEAALVSIAVTPDNQTIAKGLTQQYTATGTYTDSSNLNITNSVTWSSSNTTNASISNASGSKGLATGTNQGTTVISATLNSISGSVDLTVTEAALVSIAVTPANQIIETADTQQYIATGTYTDSSTQNITTSVTWKSDSNSDGTDDSLIAGISNSSGTKGLATGTNPGTTVISATLNSISGSTGLTVNAPAGVVDIGDYDVSLPSNYNQGTTPGGDFTGLTYYNNNGVSGFVSTVPESGSNCMEFGSYIVGQIGGITGVTSSQVSNSVVGTSPNCSSIFLLDVTTSSSQKATELSNTLIQEIGTNIHDGTVTGLPVPESGEVATTTFKVILQATYTGTGTGIVGVGVTNSDDYEANEAILAGFLDGTNIAESASTRQIATNIFTGQADAKVDFVWAVDNSGSMAEEQGSVSGAASTFFDKLGNKHLDYRLGVIPTDSSTMRSAAGKTWTTSSDGYSAFQSNVLIGTGGSGKESGIYFSLRGLGQEGGSTTLTPRSGYSWGSDYQLIFVMLTDEGDNYECYNPGASNKQSYPPCTSTPTFNTTNNYFTTNNYKVYSIIGLNSSGQPDACTGSGSTSAIVNSKWPALFELSSATGGSSASICSNNFDSIMDSIVTQVAGSASSYTLDHSAISTTISVKVNDVPVSQDATNGWTYNSANKKIVFSGTAWPAVGSTIEITYKYYVSGGFAFGEQGGLKSLLAYLKGNGNSTTLWIAGLLTVIGLSIGFGINYRYRHTA